MNTIVMIAGIKSEANDNADAGDLPAPVSPMPQEFAGRAQLTPREREVLALIAGGASNKSTGQHLGISPRTVETHRARIMDKIGARNAADLMRIVFSAGGSGRAAPTNLVA